MAGATLAAALAAAGGAAAPPHADGTGIGYRGDGTCVARGGHPPVAWDCAGGSNVLWKTPLPQWGLGCPIAVQDRVFVVCEPDRDRDFPALVCLSAADGRILWQREIDHYGFVPEADRARARELWHGHLEALRALYRARQSHAEAADKVASAAALDAQGLKVKGGAVEWAERVDVRLAKSFNKLGFYFDVWHLGGLARIGYGYPTPASDGEFVYVATGLHVFACYDLEGNLRWARRHPGGGSSNAGYGGDDFCKNARSPLLYGELLLSDVGNLARAIDRRSGELRWSDKIRGHEIVTPAIVRTGGRDVWLTAGPQAYLLPEGTRIPVEGWGNHGGTMLVKYDEPDVVFFTGGGEHGGWENKGKCATPPPAAVRFALAAEPAPALRATVLWSGLDGQSSGECHAGIVYWEGRLYHPGGCILDAASGKVLAGKHRDKHARATPQTRHLTWVAGGRLYGVREAKPGKDKPGPTLGVAEVYDLEGRKLAASELPTAPAGGERRDRIVETVGHADWGFSYGSPFAVFGERIYIRGNDYLYCIGTR
jgi:hypothetical protein